MELNITTIQKEIPELASFDQKENTSTAVDLLTQFVEYIYKHDLTTEQLQSLSNWVGTATKAVEDKSKETTGQINDVSYPEKEQCGEKQAELVAKVEEFGIDQEVDLRLKKVDLRLKKLKDVKNRHMEMETKKADLNKNIEGVVTNVKDKLSNLKEAIKLKIGEKQHTKSGKL